MSEAETAMRSIQPPLSAARLGLVYAFVLLASTPGCSAIRVHRTAGVDLFAGWHVSALEDGDLSPRTRQTLRQWDLEHVYLRHPDEAAARLHAEACRDPQPDLLFALAEIHFVRGRQTERLHDTMAALTQYYLCAGYAYHYLFDDRPADTTRPAFSPTNAAVFDPRFRLACDLYNGALAKCITAAQRVGQLDPRQQLRIPTGRGEFVLSVVHTGFAWMPEEFGPLLLCEDYQVEGLENHYRGYGLGVPLIATRSPKAPSSRYFPATASFAATAFFRFEGTIEDLRRRHCGRLELYNPLAIQSIDVAGRQVPLETDLTTPLGYFLAESKLDEIGLTGFVRGDSIRNRTGLHMLAPYQPGKIPVVLVHGLLSSPLTWAPVFNALQADPVLAERYQFWYYFYPTGEPYLAAAAQLRDELVRLRQDFDPHHADPALDEIVLAGHSMGGLVSRLLTVEGGDDFWRLVSTEPFDQLKLKDDARSELQQVFYFHRDPGIKRVIFLGTPHRGSKLSPSTVGRLAVRLVTLPRDLMATAKDVAAENPDLAKVFGSKPLPTSVDLLAPGSPALELLASRPRPRDVHYHSIIGEVPLSRAPVETWLSGDSEVGDGVVPYRSAHLDGVDSELVVPADHFHVHHHPRSILEVRRILLEHVEECDRGNGVIPAVHAPAATSPR
jgi:pimeloyl-ACP methyl ester carboxylesterase